MNEFLSTLLRAVLIVAVPVISAYFGKWLHAFEDRLSAQTDNEMVEKYLGEVTDAVSIAVTYTSQTYVDALKANGKFTKENQGEALQKAVDQTAKLLTAEARAFLEKAYGDLNAYLVSRIEAEVRVQKQQAATVLLGEPFTAELKEAPDVTTVAATTAAAIAAAVPAPPVPRQHLHRRQEGGTAPVV